jgi:hypothetical protein
MRRSLPILALPAAGAPCRAGRPVLKIVTTETAWLQEDFRRMHAMATTPDLNGNPEFFANLAAAPGRGDVIRHERSKDVRVAAVSNSRNGFSRKYRIK